MSKYNHGPIAAANAFVALMDNLPNLREIIREHTEILSKIEVASGGSERLSRADSILADAEAASADAATKVAALASEAQRLANANADLDASIKVRMGEADDEIAQRYAEMAARDSVSSAREGAVTDREIQCQARDAALKDLEILTADKMREAERLLAEARSKSDQIKALLG